MKSDLATRLREERHRARLSQPQLAELAGVRQQTIDKIERGISRSPQCLAEIGQALGVSAAFLKGLTDDRLGGTSEGGPSAKSGAPELAARLRDARTQAGFKSASALARAAGLTTARYTHYENGHRLLPVEAAEIVAVHLGVSPAYLLGLTNDRGEQAPGPPATKAAHELSWAFSDGQAVTISSNRPFTKEVRAKLSALLAID